MCMKKTNERFPVDDQGVEAHLIVTTAGIVFPFWSVTQGWGDVIAGGEYLLLAIDNKDVPEANRVPGKFPTMVLYTNRPLDLTHWALIAAQCRHDDHTPTVIRVLWNTGEELQYEHVLKPDGKRTLTYKGNISSGVATQ
ncbi:hypothetical protein CF95_gp058 [Erwinia phage PhiEaH1]|uniref:Uncharacterized protein n=1 Tax=Erwinia phage PhiEaH1 TaxID=1401669 RepID=W8CZW7_9CAUD|nr:hypothetical protein CF95_gp058 [Erwinia phage PhiEaH1]AGX01780.1 hypothetical protein [Erwinia phage PhiEaH1]